MSSIISPPFLGSTEPHQLAEDKEHEDSEPWNSSWPFTEEDYKSALLVIRSLATDEELYKRPKFRSLRSELQQIFSRQKQQMFGGMNPNDYSTKQLLKRRNAQQKNKQKAEDRMLLEQTTLRAGRMHRLEALAKQQEGLEQLGGGRSVPLILDGVAEDGFNFTKLPTDNVITTTTTAAAEDGDDNDIVGSENTASTAILTNRAVGTTIDETSTTETASPRLLNNSVGCYTCKRRFREIHHFYSKLCPSCAELNFTKRMQICNMTEKICLVTGGRVKIGFQCCLKLLRCGATVLSTSRFPADSAARFAEQHDFADWKDRIHVFGLDLRNLVAVEAFCDMLSHRFTRLDAIINNACQTVRRPVAYYSHLMELECKPFEQHSGTVQQLLECYHHDFLAGYNLLTGASPTPSSYSSAGTSASNQLIHPALTVAPTDEAIMLSTTAFTATAGAAGVNDVGVVGTAAATNSRPNNQDIIAHGTATVAAGGGVSGKVAGGGGGGGASVASVASMTSAEMSQMALLPEDNLALAEKRELFPEGLHDVNKQQLDLRTHNSWLLRMHEVSTPEVAEVFAINSISPFVLAARLKPLMMQGRNQGRNNSSSSYNNIDHTDEEDDDGEPTTTTTSSQYVIVPDSNSSSGVLSLAEHLLQKNRNNSNYSNEPSLKETYRKAADSYQGSGPKPKSNDINDSATGTTKPADIGVGAGASGSDHPSSSTPISTPTATPAATATAPPHGAVKRVRGSDARFIVNVSSMEGKFYRRKLPTHPHTNMAKAALNMMTRTSAGDYQMSDIYMTAVDTGWINDENPLERAATIARENNFTTPLDEVDAAARILDPIIAPLKEADAAGDGMCAPPFGCFLKDFFVTEW